MIVILRKSKAALMVAAGFCCQVLLLGVLASISAPAQAPGASSSAARLDRYTPEQLAEKARRSRSRRPNQEPARPALFWRNIPATSRCLAFVIAAAALNCTKNMPTST